MHLCLGAIFALLLSFTINLYSAKQSHGGMVAVTAYFPFDKSKHSKSEYNMWIKAFFDTVHTETFIFCPKMTAPHLINILQSSKNSFKSQYSIIDFDNSTLINEAVQSGSMFVFITEYSHPKEFECMKQNYHAFNTWQHRIDPERRIHNGDLYTIWSSKPWMIKRIASLGSFTDQTHFFWIDIGSRRTNFDFGQWPDRNTTETFLSKYQSDPILVELNPHKIMGTYMGCPKTACDRFANDFYRIQNDLIMKRKFAGNDQLILQIIKVQYQSNYTKLVVSKSFKNDHDRYCTAFWTAFSNPKYLSSISSLISMPYFN
jgi:hypothetical protein